MHDNFSWFNFYYYFFSAEIWKMTFETYGDFRTEFLYDIRGKLLENDELFLNIYDFYVLLHGSGNVQAEHWYRWTYLKLNKLERMLKKKWKKMEKAVKTLPIINVLLNKIKEDDATFSPLAYLNEKEQYFANLESWKLTSEETFLNSHPYLLREPIRHKKIYRFKKVWLPR